MIIVCSRVAGVTKPPPTSIGMKRQFLFFYLIVFTVLGLWVLDDSDYLVLWGRVLMWKTTECSSIQLFFSVCDLRGRFRTQIKICRSILFLKAITAVVRVSPCTSDTHKHTRMKHIVQYWKILQHVNLGYISYIHIATFGTISQQSWYSNGGGGNCRPCCHVHVDQRSVFHS